MKIKQIFEKREEYSMLYYDYKICNCEVKDEDAVSICDICNPIEEATIFCNRRPSIFMETARKVMFVACFGLLIALFVTHPAY